MRAIGRFIQSIPAVYAAAWRCDAAVNRRLRNRLLCWIWSIGNRLEYRK